METIRTHAKFDAAHRQLDYDGKCRWVHGHTWRGTFEVKAERFPRDKVLGMTVDFGALKDIYKFLDHKMLVSEHDEVFLNPDLFEPEGVVVIPGKNPNVEGVALYALNEAVDTLAKLYPGEGVTYEIGVVVQETENNVFTIERSVTI